MTFYEILRVQANASQKQIDSAYRILAAEVHPDVNPDSSAAAELSESKLPTTYWVTSNGVLNTTVKVEINRAECLERTPGEMGNNNPGNPDGGVAVALKLAGPDQ